MDDIPDLSDLPEGQSRAAWAFIGGGVARTYVEAAEIANVSLGTLKTHLRRVSLNHPKLYASIRAVRKAQLGDRHEAALQNTQAHSRAYFRRQTKWRLY